MRPRTTTLQSCHEHDSKCQRWHRGKQDDCGEAVRIFPTSLGSVRTGIVQSVVRHLLIFATLLAPRRTSAFVPFSPGHALTKGYGGIGQLAASRHCEVLSGRCTTFPRRQGSAWALLPSDLHQLRNGDGASKPHPTTTRMSSASSGGNITDSSELQKHAPSVGDVEDQKAFPTLVRKFVGNSFVQLVACCGLFAFHVFILCRESLTIPENIMQTFGIANSVLVPWESVIGTAALVGMASFGGQRLRGAMSASLSGTALLGNATLPTQVDNDRKEALPETFMLLGLAYLGSGYFGQAIEFVLYALAAVGVPLTLGMCRALQVLLAHLFWVALGSQILHKRTGDFFSSRRWFRVDWRQKHLFAMVIGGYLLTSYLSTFAINLNQLLNMADLPGLRQLHNMLNQLPESATESVLDGLKNPEANDMAARAVGAVGPCFTGPIWEEVLYRGFLLQALALFMKVSTAVDVSSLVFALNHMNARAFAHLFVVGWLWAVFYIKSRNLLVPILIHMMWNIRTFLSPV